MKLTRRRFVKALGLSTAAAGVTGFSMGNPPPDVASTKAKNKCDSTSCDPQGSNTLFDKLPTCCPRERLAADEMRITFLGTSCLPRLSQQGVSVYVEVGPT